MCWTNLRKVLVISKSFNSKFKHVAEPKTVILTNLMMLVFKGIQLANVYIPTCICHFGEGLEFLGNLFDFEVVSDNNSKIHLLPRIYQQH